MTESGKLAAAASRDTITWRDPNDARIFEQSTADIWNAISHCIHTVLADSGVKKQSVKGIGIDATCSLAVVDENGDSISITRGSGVCGELGQRNVVLWADHRAEEEAALINSSGSIVLDYVGGAMSVSFIPFFSA